MKNHDEIRFGDLPLDKVPAQKRAELKRRAQAALAAMTDEEDAKITAAALADPDARPVDDLFRRKLGRPLATPDVKKVSVTMRLDPDVVAHFRDGGPGWQTRVNEVLRKAARLK